MRNATVALVCCLVLLNGCSRLKALWDPTYYTRPESPGYTERHFKIACSICGNKYSYSRAEWDRRDSLLCPRDDMKIVLGEQQADIGLIEEQRMRSRLGSTSPAGTPMPQPSLPQRQPAAPQPSFQPSRVQAPAAPIMPERRR